MSEISSPISDTGRIPLSEHLMRGNLFAEACPSREVL